MTSSSFEDVYRIQTARIMELERELTAARKEIEELRNGIVAEAKRIEQTHVMVPVDDLIFFKRALSVAIAGLFDHHKQDVMATFSFAELSEAANLSDSLRPRQVEDIYKEMWDRLDALNEEGKK